MTAVRRVIGDLAGRRFGKLVVESLAVRHPRKKWNCVCDCGAKHVARQNNLISGDARSCGCGHMYKHGCSSRAVGLTAEYIAWQNMKRRVRTRETYRGVTICKRWRKFVNFLADMGKRPSPELSLERKNNRGPYAPWNCTWATRSEQQNNRSGNVFLTLRGRRLTLTQWARETGLTVSCLRKRLQLGWDPGTAVFTPAKKVA